MARLDAILSAAFALFLVTGSAQDIYFPPNAAGTWETVDPASLGWCTDQIPPLLDFLGENNTKAFIVLKDGRIAIEQYYGTFTQDSSWYWASAGKSLTAFVVGKAQEQGFLDINEPSSNYLGTGWSSCTPAQEAAITIRHHLTMTTGLDDGTGDLDCTDPACLQYLAAPGTRWSYHNAAYTKLDGVISGATGQSLNSYVYSTLGQTTGMLGLYLPIGYNNVFFSTPRNMARFGLLAMNGGNWNGTQILNTTYFNQMTTPSQTLNRSYGYLWWLNGQSSFMVPGSQIVFPGQLMPNEPAETINALGKNGQTINVVPSQGIVVVRMGDVPGESFPVPYLFNNDFWAYLNDIFCTPTSIVPPANVNTASLYPSPASDAVRVIANGRTIRALDAHAVDGRRVNTSFHNGVIDVSGLPIGTYAMRILYTDGTSHTQRVQVVR